MRLTWKSAAAGVMSGSRPEAEAVDEIDRDRGVGVVELVDGDIGGYAVEELLVRGRVVGAAGVGGVIAVAGGGGTRVEVAGRAEGLAEDARTDEGAVLGDELSVGLVLEEELRQAGDDERVGDSEEEGRDDGIEDGGGEVAFHGALPFVT